MNFTTLHIDVIGKSGLFFQCIMKENPKTSKCMDDEEADDDEDRYSLHCNSRFKPLRNVFILSCLQELDQSDEFDDSNDTRDPGEFENTQYVDFFLDKSHEPWQNCKNINEEPSCNIM